MSLGLRRLLSLPYARGAYAMHRACACAIDMCVHGAPCSLYLSSACPCIVRPLVLLAHARPLGGTPYVHGRLLINPQKIYYPLNRSANFYYKDVTLLDLKLRIFFVLGVFFVHTEMARFRAILPFLATKWRHHKPPLRGGRLR